MEQDLFSALENSGFSQWVRGGFWIWPIFESLHFAGLCLLFGGISVVDIRLLGFFPSVPVSSVLRVLPIAFVGLGINLVTGTAMFVTNPDRYWGNPGFKIKMGVIVVAGLNALLFAYLEKRRLVAVGPVGAEQTTATVRGLAALSLVLWTSVILLGRLFPQMRQLFG
jgi:hypothetical protein